MVWKVGCRCTSVKVRNGKDCKGRFTASDASVLPCRRGDGTFAESSGKAGTRLVLKLNAAGEVCRGKH